MVMHADNQDLCFLRTVKNNSTFLGVSFIGQTLECSLAKPQADQKSSSGGSSNSQKAALLPSHPPRVGYGLVGSPYSALGAGYGGVGYPQVHISNFLFYLFNFFVILLWLIHHLFFSCSHLFMEGGLQQLAWQ